MPQADPTASHWTYADLAVLFGRGEDGVRRLMPGWEREGFPAPLPWSLRQKRWNPQAVLRWKERRERRAAALGPPDLALVASG